MRLPFLMMPPPMFPPAVSKFPLNPHGGEAALGATSKAKTRINRNAAKQAAAKRARKATKRSG